MQNLLNWLNSNKSYLALIVSAILQMAQANGWIVLPAGTVHILTGLGVGLIPHSNSAVRTQYLKKIAKAG
jgi:hypothetical protein